MNRVASRQAAGIEPTKSDESDIQRAGICGLLLVKTSIPRESMRLPSPPRRDQQSASSAGGFALIRGPAFMKFLPAGAVILSAALALAGCSARPTAVVAKNSDALDKNQQCYQEFSALKQLNPDAYETYRAQLGAINENYVLYKSNASAIDGKAAEVMQTEIDRVLSLVCFRINNAIYSNMMQRAQGLHNQL